MSAKLIDAAALEIFRRKRRLEGVMRPTADEEWRKLGAKGRGRWRELAAAAYGVISGGAAGANATPAAPDRKRAFMPF